MSAGMKSARCAAAAMASLASRHASRRGGLTAVKHESHQRNPAASMKATSSQHLSYSAAAAHQEISEKESISVCGVFSINKGRKQA